MKYIRPSTKVDWGDPARICPNTTFFVLLWSPKLSEGGRYDPWQWYCAGVKAWKEQKDGSS